MDHEKFTTILESNSHVEGKVLKSLKSYIGMDIVYTGLLSGFAHSLLLIGPVMIKHIINFI